MEIREFKMDNTGQYKVTFTDLMNVPTWNKDTAMVMTVYAKGNKYYAPVCAFQMTWKVLMRDIRPWIYTNFNKPYEVLIIDDACMMIEIEDGSMIFSTIPQPGSLMNSRTVIPNSAVKFKSTLTNLFHDNRVLAKLGKVEHALKSDTGILHQKPFYGGKWKNRQDVLKHFAPITQAKLRQLATEKSTLHMVMGKIINAINNEIKFNKVHFLFAYKGVRDMFILFVVGDVNNISSDDDRIHYHYLDVDARCPIGNIFDAGEAYDRVQLAFQLETINNLTEREYYHELCKFLQD